MKKIITVIAASVMALGMIAPFAACKTRSYKVDLGTDTTQNRPTLKGLYPASGMSNSDFMDSPTSRLFEKLTGYKVEYSQLAGSNEESEVGNALYNPDTYDFIKCGRGSFDQYVVDDAFCDLTEALEIYGQDLLDIIDDELWEACKYNGKIYGIPEYGFGYMQDTALIFNLDHLKQADVEKIPETLSEFTETLHKLQDTFGSDKNYHAMAMTGAEAELSIISSAFEMPCEFFEDSDGTVKNYIYSQEAKNYFSYMNEQVYNYKTGCLPANWDMAQASDVTKWFTNGNISVAHLPYWYFNPLCEQIAANNSNYETAEDAKALLGWQTRIKGDGSYNSVVQEKGRMRGIGDIGYVIVIPRQSAANAPYALDWMNQRIQDENYKAFLLGEEGVSHEIVSAADATENDVEIVEADGSKTYYRLLKGYNSISNNSMYTTGGNPKIGRKYWPLREKNYDCWDILLPREEDDLMILSVIAKAPVFSQWSKVSMQARSMVLTNAQRFIKASNEQEKTSFEYLLSVTQRSYEKMYWKPECEQQVQEWYNENRRGS